MSDDKVIKVKPWGEGQGDHVLINESDFNPDVHELFDAPVKRSPGRPRKQDSEGQSDAAE